MTATKPAVIAIMAILWTRACSDDLGNWYSYRGSTCDGSSSTAVTATATTSGTQTRSPAATATISLTSCILSCQASAADSVGGVCSETNYNETECYCNTPTFATEAQDCVFDDCAGDAGILHQWRGAVCLSSGGDTGNAETEVSSIGTATATSAAATAVTTTTGSVSSATSSTTSGQSSGSGGSGLSGGAIAGICVGTIVAGLAIIGFVALTIIRRRRRYPFHGRRTNGSDAYALHKLQSDQAQQEM
ncbi:hypothetical protein ABEF95_013127 [Exophiala dermatitidis]